MPSRPPRNPARDDADSHFAVWRRKDGDYVLFAVIERQSIAVAEIRTLEGMNLVNPQAFCEIIAKAFESGTWTFETVAPASTPEGRGDGAGAKAKP